jgi:hypothetical protein
MTPKEKAEDLFMKFVFKGAETKQIAIESALIVVDEILKVASFYNDSQGEVTYWQEVKQEIENIKTK